MSRGLETVFRDCLRVAHELEGAGRFAEGVSILRALSQYLDIHPSVPDKSDKGMTDRYLAILRSHLEKVQS